MDKNDRWEKYMKWNEDKESEGSGRKYTKQIKEF